MTDDPRTPTGNPTEEGDLSAAPAAPTQPVEIPAASPSSASGPRRAGGALRWAVAILVVVLVAGVASAAFYLLSGGANTPSTVASWAPPDPLFYAEARFDLPGDQKERLGEFLAHFPGFADQSTLESKLDETFDRLIRSASDGDRDYRTNIKPWFGGQVGLAVLDIPVPDVSNAAASRARAIGLVSVTDPAKAIAWVESFEKEPGTAETYNGTQLSGFADEPRIAYGVLGGKVLAVGDLDSVHAAVDTLGKTGFGATETFKAALATASGDHLGLVFVDMKRYAAAIARAVQAVAPSPGLDQALFQRLPPWVVFDARAESDNLLFEGASPAVLGVDPGPNRVSALAPRLPGSTLAVVEAHDVGKAINAAVSAARAIPEYREGLDELTKALEPVGGLDSFTSWIGDAALVVTKNGSSYAGGLVVALPDAASASAAQAKLASLRNLATLAGSGAIKVSDAEYAGATITTLDVGDLSGLAPSGSSPSPLPRDLLGGARLALSYTIHGGLVVLGIGGDTFVKSVLDTTAGTSLADQPRYRTAVDRADGSNVAQDYLDVRAILDAVEAELPASRKADYVANVKPYLDPIQAIAVSSKSGDPYRARFVLTVSK